MVNQYSQHVTMPNGRFYPTRPHLGMCLYNKLYTIKKKRHSPRTRETTRHTHRRKKLHKSTGLDNDATYENHVTHKATSDKTKTTEKTSITMTIILGNIDCSERYFTRRWIRSRKHWQTRQTVVLAKMAASVRTLENLTWEPKRCRQSPRKLWSADTKKWR